MIASGESAPPSPPLPDLRDELQLLGNDGPAHLSDGVIFDPVRQLYFRVSLETEQLLSLWRHCRTIDDVMLAARDRFGLVVDQTQVAALLQFLDRNGLTYVNTEEAWRRSAMRERSAHEGWIKWAVHNYLFVRLPLVRPDQVLRQLTPWLAPLFTRTCAAVIAACGLAGLYLVSRQWDAFLGTFSHLFSLEGAVLYAIALAIVKSLHEMGHALTASRYGCRVPTMGVCFMVMVPMLYTDASDAWKLSSRRQRLAIDAAGLAVETALACLATLAWSFLPDGPARSLAFAIATTSWLLSLGLNLNPLMRFDGYYILSDLTGIDNLQSRAFAIGRWAMREALFGLGAPPPEVIPKRTRQWLAVYAWAVWIYRLTVFTGIAILIYHATFKLLGLVLFAIEIIFFISLPIWRELKDWFTMRQAILASWHGRVTCAIAILLMTATLIPWSTRITAPALLEASELAQVFPIRPGYVTTATAQIGATVAAGDLLVELASPELEQDIERTRLKIELYTLRLARRGSDAADRAETLVFEDTLRSLAIKLRGLQAERAELRITAPIGGRLVDLDAHLHVGRWLQRSDLIALIAAPGGHTTRGYVGEEDVGRVDQAATAKFIPEDLGAPSSAVRLQDISRVGVQSVDIADLSSHYGGAVAARPQNATRSGEGKTTVPVTGQFLVSGIVADVSGLPTGRSLRGTLLVKGRAESLAARAWRQIFKVLIRESGT